jgi:hypothetical protein
MGAYHCSDWECIHPRLRFTLEPFECFLKYFYGIGSTRYSPSSIPRIPAQITNEDIHIYSIALFQLPDYTTRKYTQKSNDCVEREVCIRQLLVKSNKSNSWFIYAKSILDLYQVASVYSLISNIPSALTAVTNSSLVYNHTYPILIKCPLTLS